MLGGSGVLNTPLCWVEKETLKSTFVLTTFKFYHWFFSQDIKIGTFKILIFQILVPVICLKDVFVRYEECAQMLKYTLALSWNRPPILWWFLFFTPLEFWTFWLLTAYLLAKIMFTAIHRLTRVDKQCAKHFITNCNLLAPGVDHYIYK